MRTNSGFDFLAPVYDSLAHLVFGKSIVNSQTCFLSQAPPKAKVLILGGGTGWILRELIKQNPSCTVWYVEASAKMIARTGAQVLHDQVYLIHGTEDDVPSSVVFDVIITNFYLDLFTEEKLDNIIQRLTSQTDSSSQWLVTDFVDHRTWWQRGMLTIMYLLFRSICNIEAKHLPNWSKCLTNHHWIETNSKDWYGGFIRSTVWLSN